MRTNSVGQLMNSLIKKYGLEQNSFADPSVSDSDAIGLQRRLTPIERENAELRRKVLELQTANKNARAEMSKATQVFALREQELEAEILLNRKRVIQTEALNEALRTELIEVNELLREQEALILQMHEHEQ